MKLVALLALLVASCGSSSSPSDGGGGAGGGSAGSTGAAGSNADGGTAKCPQFRVEGVECSSATAPGGVLRKDGHICATCKGVDSSGQTTPMPVGCTTVAGDDLCVADCGECS
jgi:hypothetical protein